MLAGKHGEGGLSNANRPGRPQTNARRRKPRVRPRAGSAFPRERRKAVSNRIIRTASPSMRTGAGRRPGNRRDRFSARMFQSLAALASRASARAFWGRRAHRPRLEQRYQKLLGPQDGRASAARQGSRRCSTLWTLFLFGEKPDALILAGDAFEEDSDALVNFLRVFVWRPVPVFASSKVMTKRLRNPPRVIAAKTGGRFARLCDYLPGSRSVRDPGGDNNTIHGFALTGRRRREGPNCSPSLETPCASRLLLTGPTAAGRAEGHAMTIKTDVKLDDRLQRQDGAGRRQSRGRAGAHFAVIAPSRPAAGRGLEGAGGRSGRPLCAGATGKHRRRGTNVAAAARQQAQPGPRPKTKFGRSGR